MLIIDNLDNSKTIALDRVKKISGHPDKIEFKQVDLKNYEQMEELFNSYKFKSVIHFAGMKAVGESVEKPLEYYDNNVAATINMLKLMRAHDVNTLVFSSSATVYGDVPLNEETGRVQPVNPYGQTKAMIEQVMKDYAVANPKVKMIALRYFNPIGAHPTGQIGEDPRDIPNNLLPYIQKVASGHLPHLRVFGTDYDTPDGTGVRDYIHVVDLAKGHVAALAHQDKIKGFEVFNLGTGKGTSVFELKAAFEKAAGKEIPHVVHPRREGDVR